jgi:hypothetical protein
MEWVRKCRGLSNCPAHRRKLRGPGEWWKLPNGGKSLMKKTSQSGSPCANDAGGAPSFLDEGSGVGAARRRRIPLKFSLGVLSLAIILGGCGADASKPAPQAEAKPAEPAVPEEIQLAAHSLLGSESQVLAFGDLAKNGKQEFLVANVVPKTPTNNLPGTIVTRVVVAENADGKWAELLRCDEHLKNQKGYLGMTPLAAVTGWRLQYEQNAEKGLQLYFTPLKGTTDSHVLPIGVWWNPATKRYQSLDRTYEHFLLESPSLQDARSTLR